MKIKKSILEDAKLIHKFEPSEPNHCEKDGCKEQLNGLHVYYFEVAKGYTMDIWLCFKHSEEFKKVVAR